jgi:hypothetical protein
MTNGDRGSSLATEIGRAIAAVYEWRGWMPETRARIRPDSAVFEALSGEYRIEGLEDFVITFRPGPDATLAIDVPGQGTMTFYAASPDEWFETADGDVMVIERDDAGNLTRAVVEDQTVLVPR